MRWRRHRSRKFIHHREFSFAPMVARLIERKAQKAAVSNGREASAASFPVASRRLDCEIRVNNSNQSGSIAQQGCGNQPWRSRHGRTLRFHGSRWERKCLPASAVGFSSEGEPIHSSGIRGIQTGKCSQMVPHDHRGGDGTPLGQPGRCLGQPQLKGGANSSGSRGTF